MITYIKRKNIDLVKYNTCINNAINSRIYALSDYLDIVADNWDALVLNDYEAVMPLPWRSKYLIQYIYPPCWTQQLGIFSLTTIDSILVDQFINAIPKKFLKKTIQLNSLSKPSNNTTKKTNYILSLDKDYNTLLSNFNKNRKRIVKKIITSDHIITENDSPKEFNLLFDKINHNFNTSIHDKNLLFKLIHKCLELKIGFILSVKVNNTTEASVFITIHQNRITNLVPIATKKGKEKNLPTALINHLINKYQNTNLFLDFEGSMIPGVAQFYKSFGSKAEEYYSFTKKF